MQIRGKWFVLGFVAGIVFLLVVQTALIVGMAYKNKKSAEEIAEQLKSPPIPSAIEADYGLNLKTLGGEPFDFSGLRGSVILLTFWNPDCASCRAQLPSIERLYAKTAADGIAIIQVAVTGTKKEDALQVIGEYGLTAPVYIEEGERPVAYHSPSMPASFVITPDGKIGFKHEGPAKWDDDTTVEFLRGLAQARTSEGATSPPRS